MHKLKLIPVVVVALLGVAPLVFAQAPKPEPTVRDAILGPWDEIGKKIVEMAEDFPEAKFDFRPKPEVRTFADVLRHVAFWNQYVAKQLRGEKVDPSPNELPKAEYATKAKIVAALRASLDEATAAFKAQPAMPPARVIGLLDTFSEHSGEHYGQLVVYYRLNDLVPPESRPKK